MKITTKPKHYYHPKLGFTFCLLSHKMLTFSQGRFTCNEETQLSLVKLTLQIEKKNWFTRKMFCIKPYSS